MKKLILIILVVLILLPVSAFAGKWKVAFIAQQETLSDGETVGYKLGPSDYEVAASEVFHITNQGSTYFFVYFSATKNQALTAYNWSEFAGVGETLKDCYYDVLARILAGIGVTANQAKYMFRAHYQVSGSWTSGNIHDWESAGSPEPVYFTDLINLYGVE